MNFYGLCFISIKSVIKVSRVENRRNEKELYSFPEEGYKKKCKYILNLVLSVKVYFPMHYTITKRVVSIAIKKPKRSTRAFWFFADFARWPTTLHHIIYALYWRNSPILQGI